MCGNWTSARSGCGQLICCCEYGSEPSGPVEGKSLLKKLSHRQFSNITFSGAVVRKVLMADRLRGLARGSQKLYFFCCSKLKEKF